MAKKADAKKATKPREQKSRAAAKITVDAKAITVETVNAVDEVKSNVVPVTEPVAESTTEPEYAPHDFPVIPVEDIHNLRFAAPNGELFYLDEYKAGDVYILRSV